MYLALPPPAGAHVRNDTRTKDVSCELVDGSLTRQTLEGGANSGSEGTDQHNVEMRPRHLSGVQAAILTGAVPASHQRTDVDSKRSSYRSQGFG